MSIIKAIKKWWLSPSCCEVNGVASCQQGRQCPVRNGTHKPSGALMDIQEPAPPFRCHDADACALGQKPCPTPSECGCQPPKEEK